MKKRTLGSILLALILCCSLALAGCGGSQTETTAAAEEETTAAAEETTAAAEEATAAAEGGITITDMTGREITLDGPADRIVALSAADCEVLYAVGAGDKLVGRGEYCDYPEEVLALPAVQSGAETNIEQIISLEPQVLLMSTMAQTEEQIAALEEAGIKVVVSDAKDIEGVYQSITTIGALTGHEEQAQEVIQEMKDSLADLSKMAADAKGDGETPTIYFEVSPLEWGLWTAGQGTFMNEVAELLGMKNVFDDLEGYQEVSEEQVIERDPDYILTITMYFGEGPTPEEEIMARPGWENVTAVKNAAILNLQNEELSRPAPRIADGAMLLFEFVYGEAQ